jgi:DNA-binding NarL/FixJ family response regulator
MQPIKVLLADDHTLVRAGFRVLLQDIPGVQVVAETGDGRSALALVQTHQPDVVLMDIAMPELNGLVATERLVQAYPQLHVLILSMHANEEYVWQALRVGAAGYLLKDADIVELELALKAVMRGETYLSPAISKQVISDYVRRVAGGSDSQDQLTPRQREILRLIAQGCSTQEIARNLAISVKTVETHRAQLMDRLNIHDVPGLVRYALRTGLIQG